MKKSRGEVENTPNPEISSKSTTRNPLMSLDKELLADCARSVQQYTADPNYDPTAHPARNRTLSSLSPGAQAKSKERLDEAPRAVDNCMNVFENISSAAQPQMSKIRLTNDNSLIGRRVEPGEENKATNSTEQPEGSISTQAQTTQEVQMSNPFLLQKRDMLLVRKAATRLLSTDNSYIAAVVKNQEYNLLYQDDLQIQNIQNGLRYGLPLIPITDNVGVNVEPPIDTLPPEWIKLLYTISCSLCVPVETLISPLLAAVFTALCGKYKIEVRNDYFEACTEYFIVVMGSGSKKSAIVQKFRIPLDKFIKQRQDEYDKKTLDNKILMKVYKKAEKKLINKFANELTGKDEDENDLSTNEIISKLQRLKKLTEGNSRPNLFNDSPTMKKLGENMMAQKEFTSIIDAEGGVLKNRVVEKVDTILLKSFTMESFGNETSTNGSVTMQHPCIVICSYMQKKIASDLYSKEGLKDDGLLPRFLPLFCLSNQIIQHTIPQDIDHELMEMYERKITNILEYCWDKRMVNGEIDILQMTDDARQKYFYFSQKVSAQINDGKYSNCQAFASKLAGHAVRLAGAIHFLEHDKPWEKPIGASAMKAGIALAEFYAEHALFAFDKKQNDSFVYAEKIINWVKNHSVANFGRRDAQNALGRCKKGQVAAGIDLLIKNKYLAPHLNFKRNMVYVVNPNTFMEVDSSPE